MRTANLALERIKHLLISAPKEVRNNHLAIILADELLPTDTGIEIECDQNVSYNAAIFEKIPGMVSVQSDAYEQRYRISSGIEGFLACYELSKMLTKHSLLNYGSGIHYHIGIGNFINVLNNTVLYENEQWILAELDTWTYRGRYNARTIQMTGHNWIRFQVEFQTMEIRIGEMTFDYQLLMKRILHGHEIARRLKVRYEDYALEAERRELERKLLTTEILPLDMQMVNMTVKSRKIRI